MKWSTPLPTGSIGMRFTNVQWMPSRDVGITRSLGVPGELQPTSNRQSSQTTYTLPALSISAVGRGPERSAPGSGAAKICAASTGLLQLLPPLVGLKDRSTVSKQSSMGTMTVPLGWTRGCPPMTQALSGVVSVGPQVSPPLVEVLICTVLRPLASSNSV